MIENPIYKGDFLHGKKTTTPTYYKNVVEPLVSKEMWECCQAQKKKNSRSYMRTQTYLFLQKLKCPKCGRIMGGKATFKKKSSKTYYYYGCNNCNNNIKEDYIEESIIHLLSDILEYDSIVSEFFLPMLKNKIENPKEQLSKELKIQEMKKERIRKAYINDAFTIDEYKKETEIIDNNIKELETKILENNQMETLKFVPEDILVKRDIDFINKIKLPNLYNQIMVTWNELSRKTKSNIIMNYIENISLRLDENERYIVNDVNFRNTFFKEFKELFDSGYIDWKYINLTVDGINYVRYSNYLPQEKVEEHIMRLREFYDVFYCEGTLDLKTNLLETKKYDDAEVVRIFPIEKDNTNKDKINMGMISVMKDEDTRIEDKEKLFETIPDVVKSNEYFNYDKQRFLDGLSN